MVSRPAIGICAVSTEARHGVWQEDVVLAPQALVEAVQRAGGLVLMLVLDDATPPEVLLRSVDGVVFQSSEGEEPDPGGADGTVRTPAGLDRALAAAAEQAGVPTVGIPLSVSSSEPFPADTRRLIGMLVDRARERVSESSR